MTKLVCPHCGGDVSVDLPRTGQQDKCPKCGEYTIIQLPSMSKKICTNCRVEFTWKLKPKQKSILIQGLVGGDEYDV